MSATLEIKVIPNASRNEIAGYQEGVLKIKVQSPPEDGKANTAVITLLARETGGRKSSISIQSGEKSRKKILRLEHFTEEQLQQWLRTWAE